MTKATVRASSSTDLRIRLEQAPCDRCEAACWTAEFWAHDVLGSGEKVCIRYADHVRSQSMALALVAAWTRPIALELVHAEREAWLMEHQPSLF